MKNERIVLPCTVEFKKLVHDCAKAKGISMSALITMTVIEKCEKQLQNKSN